MSAANDLLERLRRAHKDPDDPEHQMVREAAAVIGGRGRVARFVESAKVQDPTWSMFGVDELATAARKAGIDFDDIDLALTALFLEAGNARRGEEELTDEEREHARQVSSRTARTLEDHERAKHLRDRGPNRMNFDSA